MSKEEYLSGLERVEETSYPTYYSPGSHDRALRLSLMADKAHLYLKEFTEKDINATLLILNGEDWEKRTQLMYGVFFEEKGYIHFPADTDNPFLNSIQPIWEHCPSHLKSQIIDKAGTDSPFEKCLSGFFEGKVAHELTHFFLLKEGVNFGQRWFTEFYCDYMNYAFLKRHEGSFDDALWLQEIMPHVIYEGGLPFAEYRLTTDFNNFWVETPNGLQMRDSTLNLLWFYAKGMRGILDLYRVHGEGFIRYAVDAFKPCNDVLVHRLEASHRGLGKWFKDWLEKNP